MLYMVILLIAICKVDLKLTFSKKGGDRSIDYLPDVIPNTQGGIILNDKKRRNID
jgi:hypothetical protein